MSEETTKNYLIEASITWIRKEIIQTKIDSNTSIYYLNIKFINTNELWSVYIYVDSIRDQLNNIEPTYVTQIGFLCEEDVLQFLKEGMDFWLVEGPVSLVGNGTILRIHKIVS